MSSSTDVLGDDHLTSFIIVNIQSDKKITLFSKSWTFFIFNLAYVRAENFSGCDVCQLEDTQLKRSSIWTHTTQTIFKLAYVTAGKIFRSYVCQLEGLHNETPVHNCVAQWRLIIWWWRTGTAHSSNDGIIFRHHQPTIIFEKTTALDMVEEIYGHLEFLQIQWSN
jgi:hypothetical protein